ncbi:MAG: spermidine/putrescine ABC transporter substrate-binding protein [Bacilli bacterium]|nr:spermidine/putrescine ABC transporter substrate-binding protein [Bacilli bacterium]
MKKVIVLLLGCLLLTGCTSKQEKQIVNVLNWSSYIPDEVIKDFEKESGIKVNYGTYSSNEELLAKLSSSKKGTYDVVFPSDYMVELMIGKNMLEELDTGRLTNYANIDKVFLRQSYDKNNDYSLPFLLATSVIAYNSEKVPEITDYKDLLNPAYKNDIVLLDDERITIGAFLQALRYDINDYNDEHLEEAYRFYNQMRDNIKAFDSDSPKSFLITNETNIGILWNAEAILAQDHNPKIKIVYPKSGYALSMDNYVIVKGASHTDNAYKFIDYLLRDEVCQKIIDDYPYISTNKNTSNYSEEELRKILNNGSYIKNVSENIKKFDRLWAKMK